MPSTSQEPYTQNSSLGEKAVKGGIWVLSLSLIGKIISVARIVILARLLSPKDFGMLGVALLTISTLSIFSQTGFETALIQRKKNTEKYLDTAWTVNLIRGIILFLIAYFSAPTIAAFFEEPKAQIIIQTISFSLFLRGFQNIGVLFFKKDLVFRKHFILQTTTSLTEVSIAIFLAFVLKNVWALVWAKLISDIILVFLSYSLHPFRPQFDCNPKYAKELFKYGKWIFGSSIVIFISTQGDDAFLGKILGLTALGLYQVAFKIGNFPSSEITGVLAQITFPAYSKMKGDLNLIRKNYLRTLSLTGMISIPLTGLIVMFAPSLVPILLGEKWSSIIIPLQVIATSGMIRSIVGTGGALFNAIGKPFLDFKLNVVRLLMIVVSIYPLTLKWGITGTALSVFIGIFSAFFFWLYASCIETKTKPRDYWLRIIPPGVATILMMAVNKLLFAVLKPFSLYYVDLILSLLIGLICYALTILVFNAKTHYDGPKHLKLIKDKLTGHSLGQSNERK